MRFYCGLKQEIDGGFEKKRINKWKYYTMDIKWNKKNIEQSSLRKKNGWILVLNNGKGLPFIHILSFQLHQNVCPFVYRMCQSVYFCWHFSINVYRMLCMVFVYITNINFVVLVEWTKCIWPHTYFSSNGAIYWKQPHYYFIQRGYFRLLGWYFYIIAKLYILVYTYIEIYLLYWCILM